MNNAEFVNSIIPKESPLDFVVCKLNIKVDELEHFLQSKKEFAKSNNGFIVVDVLRSKKDPSKVYSKYSEWVPKKPVTNAQHMPDREDDMPF